MAHTTFHAVAITGDDTDLTLLEKLRDATDLASDQEQGTFFTDKHGLRLFAVVPVDFAERALEREAL